MAASTPIKRVIAKKTTKYCHFHLYRIVHEFQRRKCLLTTAKAKCGDYLNLCFIPATIEAVINKINKMCIQTVQQGGRFIYLFVRLIPICWHMKYVERSEKCFSKSFISNNKVHFLIDSQQFARNILLHFQNL